MTMSEPLPWLPPLEPQQVEEADTIVALKLVELQQLAWEVMFRMVSGFMEQPEEHRLAWYLQHEPLATFFNQPNLLARSGVDPNTGMPLPPIPAPSLMQLNSVQCAIMLADAARLYAKYDKKWASAAVTEAQIDDDSA